MLDRLRRLLNPPDEYAILQVAPEREVIARLDEPVTALEAEGEHQLQDGHFQLQEIRGGKFGRVVWKEEYGDPRRAREEQDLRRELSEIKAALSRERAGAGDFDDRLKQSTFEAVLQGDLKVRDARAIADLASAFDGEAKSSLSESVDDPKDVGEIAGRAVLGLMDEPERLEALSKTAGRAVGAAADGALEADVDVVDGDQDDAGENDPSPSAFDGVDPGPTSMDDLGQSLEDDEASEPLEPRARQRYEELAEEADESSADGDVDGEIEADPDPEADAGEAAVADGGEPPDDDEPTAEEVAAEI